MKFLRSFLDCFDYATVHCATAVLVTITRTKGSAPRNAGTRMAVALHANDAASLIVGGTIGGGNLEHKVLEIARQWLENMHQLGCESSLDAPEYKAFPLGASLGQCCGGWVEVRFEAVKPADLLVADGWLQALREATEISALRVMLFGGGHVAQALVPMLCAIGAKVTWVESREGAFTWGDYVPNVSVATIIADAPEVKISHAASGTYFLIMTHSHALDQTLTQAVLRRDDASFYGLIGSKTKRKLFENRLAMRGFSQATIAKLTCPLGIDGINSKEPAAIALAITAQIQQRREQLACTVQAASNNKSNVYYA
jgi:xanthine dehydrogenase accessory factor